MNSLLINAVVEKNNDIKDVVKELQNINLSLSKIVDIESKNSFWDSQLFAAILGASAALLVLILPHAWGVYIRRKERLNEIYNWVGAKYVFWTPKVLYEDALSTAYVGEDGLNTQDDIKKNTEKPLGEKMIIDFRSSVKYWTYPMSKIRNLFKKYENSLNEFSNVDYKNKAQIDQCIANSNKIMLRIKNLAFHKTGENEFTIKI